MRPNSNSVTRGLRSLEDRHDRRDGPVLLPVSPLDAYVPFVPTAGPETELFFDDEASNQALIELHRFIVGLIESFEPETPQVWQWPRNIEM